MNWECPDCKSLNGEVDHCVRCGRSVLTEKDQEEISSGLDRALGMAKQWSEELLIARREYFKLKNALADVVEACANKACHAEIIGIAAKALNLGVKKN